MTIHTFITFFGNAGQGVSAKKLDSIFIKINEIHEILSIHCFRGHIIVYFERSHFMAKDKFHESMPS